MARTTHHVRYNHRDANCDNHECPSGWTHHLLRARECTFSGPQHTIDDLRYSAAVLARAERTGTRPIPARVHATMAEHMRWGRGYNETAIAFYADWREGITRTRIGSDLRAARTLINAALREGDEDAFEAADDLDFEDGNHHHNAAWYAW
jgi:hypothetical protein